MTIPSLQQALPPDYSRSARWIYASAIKAYVSVYKDLDIMAYNMHGTSSEKYPSWCPNWDLPRSRITLGGPIHTRGFAASDNEPPVAEFSDDSNTLWLKGFRVDGAREVALQGTRSEFSWEKSEVGLKANWDVQSIAQKIVDLQEPSLEVLVPFSDDTKGHGDGGYLAKSQKLGVIKALVATLAAGDVPMPDESWFTGGRKPLTGENMIQEPVLVQDNDRGQYWPPDLEGFFELLCHKTWGRTLILSSSGKLGLVPKDVEVGDEIFIIHGFRTPAILCKRSDAAYTWIGDACIDGIMSGEAMKDLRNGLYVEENIALR